MKQNEAGWDRGIRIAVGLGLLSLTVIGPQTMWGLVGLVPIATGSLGVCPLYSIFGFSTCAVKDKTANA